MLSNHILVSLKPVTFQLADISIKQSGTFQHIFISSVFSIDFNLPDIGIVFLFDGFKPLKLFFGEFLTADIVQAFVFQTLFVNFLLPVNQIRVVVNILFDNLRF